MKAVIVNPYLDSLGGGERYSMFFAMLARDLGYKVDVEFIDPKVKSKLEERFSISLKNIRFINQSSRGDGYDLCFWVSDGSVPTLRARVNVLHFQVPFIKVGGSSLINRMKMFRIKEVVCNSNFTKSYIDHEYNVNSKVVYPPVDISKFKTKKKENIILYVGRFSKLMQRKGQDILIQSAIELFRNGVRGWKLVIAGGAEIGSEDFIDSLNEMAKGYPIEILESPSFSQLQDLYGHAKLFWSASGFGIDEKSQPERVEHFGITPVEAMSAGCVPLLFNSGGHKEIIQTGENGYLWETIEGLVKASKYLIEDDNLWKVFSQKASNDVNRFSVSAFNQEFTKIIV